MSGDKPPDPDKSAQKWRDRLFRRIIDRPMPHFDRVAYRAAICERIAVARANAQLSQQDLAEAIGVPVRTYRGWEAGIVPSAEWVGLIADECHVSAEWIVGRPHGEAVWLVNRKVERNLLAATAFDEGTRQRATRLATIADEGLEACATIEAYAIRVGKVWAHLEDLKKQPQEGPPKEDSPRAPRSRRSSRSR